MSEYESLTGDQREFEQLLQQLTPAEVGIDVAQLMFRAGRQSADGEYRRRLRRWQGATFATAACAFVMAALLAWPAANDSNRPTQYAEQPNVAPVEHREQPVQDIPNVEHQDDRAIAQSPAPVPAAEDKQKGSKASSPLLSSMWKSLVSVQTPADDSYLSLRNRVLESGVDSLPERRAGGESRKEPLSTSPGRVRQYINRELGPGLLQIEI